jgi:hypothetical protein
MRWRAKNGILAVLLVLGCGKADPPSNAGQPSSAGQPAMDSDAGAAGQGASDAGADAGRGGAPPDHGSGGAAGVPNGSGEAGQPSIDISIADGAEVEAADCDGGVSDVPPELARFCLLDALCNDRLLGDCVWLQTRFEASGGCAREVTTCAELEACAGPPDDVSCAERDKIECVGDVLHTCDEEGNLLDRDCAALGLRCLDVEDPHTQSAQPACTPSGCAVDYDEPQGSWCRGDSLVGATSAVTGGNDTPATVTLYCPDFGFSTCHDGRCVY